MAMDFFAGCVGGAAGILVGHPLDTVKVRIQTQCPVNPKYRGTFHCLSSIAKQESIAGLYKGIASPLYGVTAVNAMVFGVYGLLKPLVVEAPGNDALWAHFLAGSVSGAVQSVVASPMELVKTRMQLDESPGSKGKGAWEVLKNIYMKEGGLRRGLFKGWCVTLAREIPGLGTYFATYEALTSKTGREVNTFEMLMAGGMAGVFSWIACFPMDVVKTRLQSDVVGKYTGAIDCYRQTVANEGYKALFRGLNSTVIRAFPTNAATFTAVMWVMKLAHEAEDGLDQSKKDLEMLLKQWDTAQVQEKIVDSLRLQTPQYAFLSVATQLGANNSNFFQQQNHGFAQALAKATAMNNKAASNNNNTSKATSTRSESVNAHKSMDNAKQENISRNISSSNENVDVVPALVPTIEKRKRTRTLSSSSHYLYPQFSPEDGSASDLRRMSLSAECSPVPEASTSSDSKSNASVKNSTVSNKGDLIVMLAEILDLPLVVVENSLDGKPITLFNIIVTWLKEGTHFSNFCKCLDALDHCVCYAR